MIDAFVGELQAQQKQLAADYPAVAKPAASEEKFVDDIKRYQECFGLAAVFLMTKRAEFAEHILRKAYMSNVKFMTVIRDDRTPQERRQVLYSNYRATHGYLKKLLHRYRQY